MKMVDKCWKVRRRYISVRRVEDPKRGPIERYWFFTFVLHEKVPRPHRAHRPRSQSAFSVTKSFWYAYSQRRLMFMTSFMARRDDHADSRRRLFWVTSVLARWVDIGWIIKVPDQNEWPSHLSTLYLCIPLKEPSYIQKVISALLHLMHFHFGRRLFSYAQSTLVSRAVSRAFDQ